MEMATQLLKIGSATPVRRPLRKDCCLSYYWSEIPHELEVGSGFLACVSRMTTEIPCYEAKGAVCEGVNDLTESRVKMPPCFLEFFSL